MTQTPTGLRGKARRLYLAKECHYGIKLEISPATGARTLVCTNMELGYGGLSVPVITATWFRAGNAPWQGCQGWNYSGWAIFEMAAGCMPLTTMGTTTCWSGTCPGWRKRPMRGGVTARIAKMR